MGRARQIASSENMDRIILNGTDVTGTTDAGDFLLLDASDTGTDVGFFVNTEIGTTETPLNGSIVSSMISNANLEMPNTLDMNGKELILDADADTSITADTGDQIDIKVGGTDTVKITSGDITITSTADDANAAPSLNLDRVSASPADADVMGKYKFSGQNDAGETIEYANIQARISDASDGTEDGRMRFETMLGGSLVNRLDIQGDELVVNEGGNNVDFRVEGDSQINMILVDAENDSVRLGSHTAPDVANTRVIINGSSTDRALDVDRPSTTGTQDLVRFYSNVGGTNTNIGAIECNGDFLSATNSFTSLSDERFKQDIVDSGSQWDDIKAMRVRKYRRKNMVAFEGDNAPVEIGVIAQELEASGMDGLVKTKPKDDENKEEYKTVKYTVLYMKAVKALQEAMARIETLEAEVAKLKG